MSTKTLKTNQSTRFTIEADNYTDILLFESMIAEKIKKEYTLRRVQTQFNTPITVKYVFISDEINTFVSIGIVSTLFNQYVKKKKLFTTTLLPHSLN